MEQMIFYVYIKQFQGFKREDGSTATQKRREGSKKCNFTEVKRPPVPKYVSVYLAFSCLFAHGNPSDEWWVAAVQSMFKFKLKLY